MTIRVSAILRITPVLLLSVLLVPDVSVAQRLNRDVAPTPGPSPSLHLPVWTRSVLQSGATLVIVEKHDLPLVAVNIDFVGGNTSYEPANKRGTSDFAAAMLSEGTLTRTADEISNAQQLLGTSIEADVKAETGTIRFTSLKDKFEPALALAADMMINSTFPDTALERIRARKIVELTQERDEPDVVARNVFSVVTYGAAHPYGRVVTDESVKGITRDDVVSFAKSYYQPGRAVITVSGDVTPATARAVVERALANWKAGGSRPSFSYGPAPQLAKRTIYLVDKPGAAQSVFAFGAPGPSRATPDYFPIRVMNKVLGELFQSRLNHDVREVRGFSYGFGSRFSFGRGPGAFRARGDIVSSKSDSALVAVMNDLSGTRGDVPFTDDEIAQGKESLIESLPEGFSSVEGIAASISDIYLQDLPESYYRDFGKNVTAVTKEDVVRVARKYVDVDHLNLVIVGDRASIQRSLERTGVAPIVIVNADGKPVVVQ